MSIYRNFVESASGYARVKNSQNLNKDSRLEQFCSFSETDHRRLGQVVVLPENQENACTDYWSSDELQQKARQALNELNPLAT